MKVSCERPKVVPQLKRKGRNTQFTISVNGSQRITIQLANW